MMEYARLLKLSGNKEEREGGAARGTIMRRGCYLDHLKDRNEESCAGSGGATP